MQSTWQGGVSLGAPTIFWQEILQNQAAYRIAATASGVVVGIFPGSQATPTKDPRGRPRAPVTPPRRVHEHLPVELWLDIFAQVDRRDLVNLVAVSKYIGAVAERLLYREARLRSCRFETWTAGVSCLAVHRAAAVRSLTLSLAAVKSGLTSSANAVLRLAGAVQSFEDLRELRILDAAQLHQGAAHNIFRTATFTRLRKFACDSDALVRASWPGLSKQVEMEEFRGLRTYAGDIPWDVTPAVWPKLRVLDSGATFVGRVTAECRVTHLSVAVPRATAASFLARITGLLGHQLETLRVVRTILCAQNSGESRWAPAGQARYWESDSPVVLCAALHAPVLRMFELRDEVSGYGDPIVTRDTLRKRPEFDNAFRVEQGTERTPLLQLVIWRPVWTRFARCSRGITQDSVLDIFALLPPVRHVCMPLVNFVPGTAGSGEEGWSVFEVVKAGWPAPPPWWEGDGTVIQRDGYKVLGELWTTL